jgi:hypothetical protein
MKKIITLFVLIIAYGNINAQKNTYAEVGGAVGSGVGSFGAALHKNWTLGKKDKLIIGTGVRFTGFVGSDQNFITAPAKLTADEKNIDTLFAPKPALYALNAMINLGYRINSKIELGFNIDVLGFSFGPEGKPSYIRNGRPTATTAKPTSINLLLVGDNDKGSLNSHFYGKYNFNEKLGVTLAYQYLFNELTTTAKVQTIPEANDRFRLKSGMIYAALTYSFKKKHLSKPAPISSVGSG